MELRKCGNPGAGGGTAMFQTPHFSSDSWVATSTPLHSALPQDLELQSERQDVVSGGGTSFQVTWRLPPLLPYVNKNLIKEVGGGSLSKKEEKVKKEKKRRERKRK